MDPAEPETGDEQVLTIDFRRYAGALRKYVWLLAALIIMSVAGAVVYTTRQTAIYQATASVQVEPKLPDLLGTGDLFNVAGASAEYYKQQKQVLSSFTLIEKTIDTNDLLPKILTDDERKDLSHDDQLDLATLRLQDDLVVKYPENDRIFYVSVRSASPADAKMIADAHVSTYESYAKGLLQLSSNTASEALQTEFTEAETKLRAAEQKIYDFQAKNDMVAVTIEAQQSLVQGNILAFTGKLNDAQAHLIELSAKLGEMKKEQNEDVLANPTIMMGDNPSYEALRTQYYTEKIHLIELEKDLGPKNPDYMIQKQKVDLLYQALQGELKILIRGTEDLYSAQLTTNAGLTVEIDKYKQEAKKLSPLIEIYNELMREKKEYDDKYNILRARLSSMQMTGSLSSIISNVRGLDHAQLPTKPVSPNLRINVTIAAVLALVVGILIIFLIVFLDRSIKSVNDATQAAGAPVLGVIPQITAADLGGKSDDRARDMYVHENPKSSVAECCRSLRTNILFSAADRELKTLVVCSANQREGKTTSVIYLGTTMAQSGARTLLIDSDMRRPRLHKSTNVALTPGLSNLLIGDDNYDSLIKPTEVENLFVLPCGPTPPNPAELLLTKRFETVLGELAKRFDRIILDSPPIQPVTDAVVLSKRVDGVVLVVRASKTMRDELRRSAKMIRDVGGSIVGVIVNELDARDRYGYGYGGYGYGGRYGAYYGHDADKPGAATGDDDDDDKAAGDDKTGAA
ncbi:MAG TPA: polysaccharide biosynthesis tyrosine autokinase [Kofleriaceae bacterium]|jgi:capsular exopolysaccharide synthesis family protein|nr:polysaccharide biosynthesis tyrosine autokinase [Kofleriaceae bacterium]